MEAIANQQTWIALAMPKGQELTEKQRKYVVNRAKGLNKTKSAIKAGYAPESAAMAAYQVEKAIAAKMPQLLEKANHGPERLIRKYLIPLLKAKETKFFQKDGIVRETREVVAHNIRLSALDMAFKLGGHYAEDHQQTDLNINIVWGGAMPAWASPAVRPSGESQAQIELSPLSSAESGLHNGYLSDTEQDEAVSNGVDGVQRAGAIPPEGVLDVGEEVLAEGMSAPAPTHSGSIDDSVPDGVPCAQDGAPCTNASSLESGPATSAQSSQSTITRNSESSPTSEIPSQLLSEKPSSNSSTNTTSSTSLLSQPNSNAEPMSSESGKAKSVPALVAEHKLEWTPS